MPASETNSQSFEQALSAHEPDDEAQKADGNLSLRPFLIKTWEMVIRHRLLIGLIIVGVFIFGLVVTLLMSPQYTAEAQIQINREQKNITNVQGVEGATSLQDQEFYSTQYALLEAETLAERVSRELKLTDNPEFYEAHGVERLEMSDLLGVTSEADLRQRRQEQVVKLLLKHIDISPIRSSRLVDIRYTSESPTLSANIVNAWSKAFIAMTMDRDFASTADARKFLEERLEQLRIRLEQSERDAVNYASSRDIVTLETTSDVNGRTISQRTLVSADIEAVNQALLEARNSRIEAQSRMQNIKAEGRLEYLSNPAINSLKVERAKIASQYQEMLVRFRPDYAGAVALKRQLDTLDASIARETGKFSTGLRDVYEAALSQEKQLQAQLNTLKARYDAQRQDSIQYNIYQREADTNRQLYDALLQRYKEIGVAGSVGVNNIAIIDPAKVPRIPSAPNLPLNLVLSLLAGLILAIAIAYILEELDDGIRSPDDVRTHLKQPVLGNIPKTKDVSLEDLEDAKSAISEAYFSVRSTLAFSTNHGVPKSMVITSTSPNEGKSFTAASLATVISRTGKTVVLVDGDMRSPSINGLFKTKNEIGLSNILAGETSYQEAMLETENKGLSLITTGPMPPNPAELLSSDYFKNLIEDMCKEYDHVIVDAPPLLGFSDSLLMGKASEGLLYVIAAEDTSRRAAQSALKRLESVGTKIFGVIVTKVDFSNHSYGYGYGYGYGDGYSYGSEEKPKKSWIRKRA